MFCAFWTVASSFYIYTELLSIGVTVAEICTYCGNRAVLYGECQSCGQPNQAATTPRPDSTSTSTSGGTASLLLSNGQRHSLGDRPLTIGTVGTDLVISDPTLSAGTAATILRRDNGAFALRAMSPAVRINGEYITKDVALTDGMRIEIGSITLIYNDDAARPAPRSQKAQPASQSPKPIIPPILGSSISGSRSSLPGTTGGGTQSIIPVKQSPVTPPTPPPGTSINVGSHPLSSPPPGPPPIQLRDWHAEGLRRPVIEGVVKRVEGPFTSEKRPAMWKEITAGIFLGKISPWLTTMATSARRATHVWTVRVLEPTGTIRTTVVFNQEPHLGFEKGDTIAVWGAEMKEKRQRRQASQLAASNPRILMERAYVYETQEVIQVAK